MPHLKILICFLFTCLIATAAPDFTRYAFTLEVKNGKTVSHEGTGCLVKVGTTVYYLTAHHIFGDMADTQRARQLKSLTVVNELNHQVRFTPVEFIPVAHVKNLTKTDFMIFKMQPSESLNAYAVTVAPAAAGEHEVVYLAARLPGRSAGTYELKITAVSGEQVSYAMIANQDKYTGASGGPLFNAKGQLAGTYTGHTTSGGVINGLFGTPYAAMCAALGVAGGTP